MTHTYEIVPGQIRHLSMIAPNLRALDLEEILVSGMVPRNFLRALFRQSTMCGAGFVDGEIAAVWGCGGMMMASVGHPWFFTTAAIERVPMAFVKEARAWLSEVMCVKSSLVTTCLATYEKSLRFWSIMGFRIGGDVILPNGSVFRQLLMDRSHGV